MRDRVVELGETPAVGAFLTVGEGVGRFARLERLLV